MQACDDEAPITLEKVPAAHEVHDVAAGEDHVPTLQLRQSLIAVLATVVEKVPPWQALHDEDEGAADHVPAGQLTHAEDEVAETWLEY